MFVKEGLSSSFHDSSGDFSQCPQSSPQLTALITHPVWMKALVPGLVFPGEDLAKVCGANRRRSSLPHP